MNKRSYISRLKPVNVGTAMSDMALLLLIFFMSTTAIEPSLGIDVDLPSTTPSGTDQPHIVLTITKNNDIFFDDKKINYDELQNELSARQREKELVISIKADKDLEYRYVARVLNILRDQEFLNVVFLSQPYKKTGDGEN
jgi:biopolymer transport protein ExbD